MPDKISSLDSGYVTGDLSIFPEALDDDQTLYRAKNNSETKLKQSLSFNAKYMIVEDTSSFPESGIVRVGTGPASPELIYYEEKTAFSFKKLIRGYSGSIQSVWQAGAPVVSGVMAEAHNAVKDAIINIEDKIGTSVNPSADSLNGIITQLEHKYLTPRAMFRAFPKSGPPPLSVRFQNFSEGDVVRYLWDFGDGSKSIEKSPNHTYSSDGFYTVKLDIVTSTGGQGSATKSNYIKVSESEAIPFFYISQENPSKPAYSEETAYVLVQNGKNPKAEAAVFVFVDQTDGDIVQRYWAFGDGNVETIDDPNIHTTTHTYQAPGEYEPFLMIVFADDAMKRVTLQEKLVVI